MDKGACTSSHARQEWWSNNGPGKKFVLPVSAWEDPAVESWLEQAAVLFQRHLAFVFVPIAVGLMACGSLLRPHV
jgi:hypothetical protein